VDCAAGHHAFGERAAADAVDVDVVALVFELADGLLRALVGIGNPGGARTTAPAAVTEVMKVAKINDGRMARRLSV
jgi:hypothetical protein